MKLNVRPRTQPEVNLTSLIDVVLLLLIFFMVSTSFVKESQINIQLPQSDDSAPVSQADDQLEITITATGKYYVNGRELINSRPETIRNALRRVSGGDTGRPVTISADANATHQSVVTAMDVVSRMGFTDFNIATVKDASDGWPLTRKARHRRQTRLQSTDASGRTSRRISASSYLRSLR